MGTDVSRTHGAPRRGEGDERHATDFAGAYPHIAKWVNGYGWIEMGDDLPGIPQRSFIRALDEGGLIWEGAATYPTVDDALRALDEALGTWIREELGE